MTIIYVCLAIWGAVATYGWHYNLRSSREWRLQFMVERGCDTQETREYLKRIEAEWTSDTK